MKEHQKILANIIGKDAIASGDFKVNEDVRLLCYTVNYLFGQLGIIQGMMDKEDMDYISDVELKALEILKGK